jgi:integrase
VGIYFQTRPNGTPYGTLVIDRVIDGKRLKITTGSKDKKTARRMDDLITDLKDRGMDSHLRHLVEGKVSIRQLFEMDQKGTLYNPHLNPEVVQPLREVLDDWVQSYKGWTEKTRKGNSELLRTMFDRVGKEFPSPSIEEIPKVLRRYRDLCESNDTPRTFNIIRSVFQRFVKLRFGRTSDLYVLVGDVEKIPDRPKNPQTSKTPGQIDRLVRSLPEKYRGMVWTMCTTGVGWSEYGQMTSRSDLKNPRIFIEGTKTDKKDERRKREVPLVYSPTPRVGSEKQFRKVLSTVSKKLKMDNVRIYTFRKCYSNWMVESGVPQWRVEMYMGHLPRSQTQKYQTTETYVWLNEDSERLKKYLEEKRGHSGVKQRSDT